MVLLAGVLLTAQDHKICTKQNRCIRSKFFANGREHVNPYYNLLGILKFENIYRLKVSLFAYKFKNDKSNTPAVLLNILTAASEIHSYNAANQNVFNPSVCTNYGNPYLNSLQQKSGNLSHQNLMFFIHALQKAV